MANLTRFGRRLNLPSTRQIRHELIMVGLTEDARLKAQATKTDEPAVPVATHAGTGPSTPQ